MSERLCVKALRLEGKMRPPFCTRPAARCSHPSIEPSTLNLPISAPLPAGWPTISMAPTCATSAQRRACLPSATSATTWCRQEQLGFNGFAARRIELLLQ